MVGDKTKKRALPMNVIFKFKKIQRSSKTKFVRDVFLMFFDFFLIFF